MTTNSKSEMKRIKPRLFLVGRPSFDTSEFSRFLDSENQTWEKTPEASDPDIIVEAAGRICYMSFGTKQARRPNSRYIENLIIQGHESVLEHANWSFILTGVSRAFTHQFVRHRVGFSFSQLSQQYHEETDAEFIEPSVIASMPELSLIWQRAVKKTKEAYSELLELLESMDATTFSIEQKREISRAVRTAARSVLPNATETKIFFTANARAIRHFLTIRGSIPGDEEMRTVSAMLLGQLQREAAGLFADFTIEYLNDGTPIIQRVALASSKATS